jgi:hypothetical protein
VLAEAHLEEKRQLEARIASLTKDKESLTAMLEQERENVHNSDAQLEHAMRQVLHSSCRMASSGGHLNYCVARLSFFPEGRLCAQHISFKAAVSCRQLMASSINIGTFEN